MYIFADPNAFAAKQLLSESSLPIEDITAQHLQHFFGCGSGLELEGVVGLELYGEVALLRSLAVSLSRRGGGVGSGLVAHAERHARDQGVQSLYLLTTTAEQFFLRRGYARVPREKAPAAIKGTTEFSGICPASSAFMVKHLDPISKMHLTVGVASSHEDRGPPRRTPTKSPYPPLLKGEL